MSGISEKIKDLFDAFVEAVVNSGGSDIHLSPTAFPKMRVNGRLVPIMDYTLTEEDTESFGRFLLAEGKMDKVVHEAIGDCDFAISYKSYRFRGNIARTRNGLVIALRLLPRLIPTFQQLGLPSTTIVDLLSQQRGGIILVTGPTGSGKTTTMAAMVDYLNTNTSQHIITIEAPVEYEHNHKRSNVDQRALPEDSPTFAAALRASLRQDPDVVLVGEMRDLETVQTALSAAETGHLILSTLHTNSAPETVNRLVDVFPANQQAQIRTQVSMSLIAVLSQRLIPKLDGKGRIAAFELMISNSAVRSMIRENKIIQLQSTIETGKAQGMISFNDSLKRLVGCKIISMEEARRYASDPKNFN